VPTGTVTTVPTGTVTTVPTGTVATVPTGTVAPPIRVLESDARNMQMVIVDKTASADDGTFLLEGGSEYVMQIFTLKNLRQYHDTTAYSKVQSIVINNDFYAQLGDKLKDFPQVVSKTPLISLQFFSQKLERQTKIFILRGNTTIQITELKAAKKGHIFAMIIERNDELDSYIISEHIKRGIDPKNTTALWKKEFNVVDPNEVFYLNVEGIPFGNSSNTTTKYTFYAVATDERITPWAEQSSILKIQYEVNRYEAKYKELIHTFFAVLVLLFGLIKFG